MNERFQFGAWVDWLLKGFRHPFHALGAVIATWCLTLGIADTPGWIGALLGSFWGVVAGTFIGASRTRDGAILAAGALAWLVQTWVTSWIIDSAPVPALLGPAGALNVASFLGWGCGAFVVFAVFRALSSRYPLVLVAELACFAALLIRPFLAHRDGVIARPLWLSDASFRLGIDPMVALVVVGALVAVALLADALVESRERLPRVAWLVLPALVLFSMRLAVVRERSPAPPPEIGDMSLPATTPPEPAPTTSDDTDLPPAPVQPSDSDSDVDTDLPPRPAKSEGEGDPNQDPTQDAEDDDTSDSLVAVVLLGDDFSPPNDTFYLRQEVLSEFDGRRLVPAPDVDHDVLDHLPTRAEVLPVPPDAGATLVHQRVALLAEHPQPFALATATSFTPTKNPDPRRFVRAYEATSLASTQAWEDLLHHQAGNPAWTQAERDIYTEPPPDPRYAALAQRLVAELPEPLRTDPFAEALAIKRYLDEHMRYTRSARHADAVDPVADFLFGDMTGYCVHSAHASVYLWRSLGLPARMSTGYAANAENRRGSSLILRGSDAHAWPELSS